MRTWKQFFCMLLGMVFTVFFLSGCSGLNSQKSGSGMGASGGQATHGQNVILSPQTQPFHMATPSMFNVDGSGNKDGFYQAMQNDDLSYNIMYVDYNTGRQLYLCAQPNCQHNSDSCTSWLASVGSGRITPVALDNQIALVYSMEQGSTTGLSKIDIADANGANKRTLHTFEAGTSIDEGAAVNGESLILKMDTYSTQGDGVVDVRQAIVGVNLTTGEATTLYEIAQGSNDTTVAGGTALFLRGATKAGLIFKTISLEEYVTTDDVEQNYANMEQATKHTYYLLPADGSEVRELLTHTQGTGYAEVNGDSLVYLQDNAGVYSLNKIDPETGEKSVVIENLQSTELGAALANPTFADLTLSQISIDNYAMVNFTRSETLKDNGTLEIILGRFAINLENGEMKEISLQNYYRATGVPVYIVNSMGDNTLMRRRTPSVPPQRE